MGNPQESCEGRYGCRRARGSQCALARDVNQQIAYVENPSSTKGPQFTAEGFTSYLLGVRGQEKLCQHPEEAEEATRNACEVASEAFGVSINPTTLTITRP